MILNEKQEKKFEEIVRPLIAFLNDNCHPHITVIVDCTNAELVEGIYSFGTRDYLKN